MQIYEYNASHEFVTGDFDYTIFFCLCRHSYRNNKKYFKKTEAEIFYISFQILIICMSIVIFKDFNWLKTSEIFPKPGERQLRT